MRAVQRRPYDFSPTVLLFWKEREFNEKKHPGFLFEKRKETKRENYMNM
jgi:hypothetical protein